MTTGEARSAAVEYWWGLAQESLATSRLALQNGLLHSAINRAYYAAFYAVTALLLAKGLNFKRHTGVRAALHREFVKKGLVSEKIGELYDQLFSARQHGDYMVLTEFDEEAVREKVGAAEKILRVISSLVSDGEEP